MQQTPIILGPGEGLNYWLIGDRLTFKVTGEQSGGAYAIAVNSIPPGGGPPPHVHYREDECFYVLEGTMQFGYGQTGFTGGPGTAVFLKRGVTHCFKNVGDTPARFVLLATPAGFERFAAEAGESFERVPPDRTVGPADIERILAIAHRYGIELRPDWRPTAPPPAPRKDRKLWVTGLLITLKLTARETDGRVSVAEIKAPPGNGVFAHSHRDLDETFYVLDGEWEFTVNGQATRLTTGALVHVPKGVTHAFRNVGPKAATLLDYHHPGGFDLFFEEAGVEAIDETTPPEFAPVPPDRLAALLDKYGMDLPD